MECEFGVAGYFYDDEWECCVEIWKWKWKRRRRREEDDDEGF